VRKGKEKKMTTMKGIRAAFLAAVALAAPAATVQGAPVCGTWETVKGPDTSGFNAGLEAIAMVDKANVWAAGSIRKDGVANPSPLVMRWNGAEWAVEMIPDLGYLGAEVALESIAVVEGLKPVVAGHYRDASSGLDVPLLLTARGGFWQADTVTMASTVRGALLRDVAVSRTETWAVGEAASVLDGVTLTPFVARSDGDVWREVPVVSGAAGRLVAVAVAGENDVWAVGHSILSSQIEPEITLASIYHWNGKGWAAIEHPGLRPGTVMHDVVAISNKDIWAVGQDGANGLFLHFDGTQWTEHASPADAAPTAVAAAATDDVWAVGAKAHYHFDGASWTAYPATNMPLESERRAIAISSPCDLWTVGAYADAARSYPFLERMVDPDAPAPPPAPVAVTASAPSYDKALVEWTGAGDETGFVVERCAGDAAACGFAERAAFTAVVKLGAGGASHVDAPLKAETFYTYRVQAFNGAGFSGYSDLATVFTPAAPAPSPSPESGPGTGIGSGPTPGPVPDPQSPESDPLPTPGGPETGPAPGVGNDPTPGPVPDPQSPESEPAPSPAPQSPESDPGPAPQTESDPPVPQSPEAGPVGIVPDPETTPGPVPTPSDPGPVPAPPADPGPVPTSPSDPGPVAVIFADPQTVPGPSPSPVPACPAVTAEIVVVPAGARGEALLMIVLVDGSGASVEMDGCLPVKWTLESATGEIVDSKTTLYATLRGKRGAYQVRATAANGVGVLAAITIQ
jgi:hypothetical protein